MGRFLSCKAWLKFKFERADGGNVELVEIDGPVVYLKLQGACGSCPSSLTTMTMGIKRRLQEKIPVRGQPLSEP
jgi:Fe-S cluster biogenesis protein NfuA